jgi:glycine cleavage system transcriptional repressor
MLAARTLSAPLRRCAAAATAGRATRGAAAAAAVASNDRYAAARGQHLVLSLAGADRVGIVKEFTRTAVAHEANVEETRMARLGGEFCIIGMLSLPKGGDAGAVAKAYEAAFPDFNVHFRTTVSTEEAEAATGAKGHQAWTLDLEGPDSLGIVASVTEELAKTGSNIHEMETETKTAPFAGFEMFTLRAEFSSPASEIENLLKAMALVEGRFGVDIKMARSSGDTENANSAT